MGIVGINGTQGSLRVLQKGASFPLGNRLLSGIARPKKQGKGTVGREDRECIENASGSEEHHRQKL